MADPEDGDRCRKPDCDGTLHLTLAGECTCHLSPPCAACTYAYLECDVCGEVYLG